MLKILKKTKSYIIVHKPAGLVVYADSTEDQKISCQNLLEKQIGQKIIPVHRIDKSTCGILIYALNQPKANQLTSLFRNKKIEKSYLAFCHGDAQNQIINLPLKKNKKKEMESALTHIQNLKTIELEARSEQRKYCLVAANPQTGRYHQVRRHLKLVKCPIVGDPLYGNSWNNQFFKDEYGINRTLLSAISVAFIDPESKEKVMVKTKPDIDFVNLLNILNIKVTF